MPAQVPSVVIRLYGATPSLAMPSDIQVFVKWKEQTIFAGEDVECIITFKNVAESSTPEPNEAQRTPHQRQSSRTITAGSAGDNYFSLKSPHNFFFNGNSRRSLPGSPRAKTFDRSHRPATSLGSPFLASHSFPPLQTPSRLGNGHPSNHKHKRSVSILSIDSEGGNDKTPVPSHFNRPSPARGHGRSASLQVLPRRNEGYDEGSTTGITYFTTRRCRLQLTVWSSWAKSQPWSSLPRLYIEPISEKHETRYRSSTQIKPSMF